MTHVTLRVHEDGADDERIEQLAGFLRTELQELVPVSTAPGEVAEGAKAIDLAELGTLLATVSQSPVLAALINAVSAWLGQRRERSVTVEADGDQLELTGAPTDAERARAAEWLERRRLRRYALIIASYEFTDPGLSSLRAPAHDAARLGEVLADPRIGGFEVQTLINSTAAEVNEAVEDFFADRDPDDLLVLHFSGHGVKDEAGELHFATSRTRLSRLAGTAVSADFVARRMNRSRSRRIVLLLDCCYSGAFGRGMVARAGGAVGLEEQFGGSGRAVITASSSMEYAFEGAAVADSSEGEPSVFTSALVEGLESGDADRDQDGHVGLDELYEYVYDRVRRVTPHQTPGKWMLDVRGDLRIARRARPVSVPSALPSELQEAIDHSLPGVRAGAVPELRRMLTVAHEGRALAARLALRRLADDDSRMVSAAARTALGEGADLGRGVSAPTSRMAARESAAAREAAAAGREAAKGSSGQDSRAARRAEGASSGRAGGAGASVVSGHASESSGAGTSADRGQAGVSGAAETRGPASRGRATGSGVPATGRATEAAPGGSVASAGSGSATDADVRAGAATDADVRAGAATDADVRAGAATGADVRAGAATGADVAAATEAATGADVGAVTDVATDAATGADVATGAAHAHAGVPSDREPPHSTLLGRSDTAAEPETATPVPPPSIITTASSRLSAALALTLLVFGLAITPFGLLGPVGDRGVVAALVGTMWPWALVAAMFVLVCREHPWVPGAALGLLAGAAGMLATTIGQIGASDVYWWLLLGLAAVVVAAACHAHPWWLAVAGGVLGAAGVFVLTYWGGELKSIDGDEADVVFVLAVIALVGLAGYRVWREKAWMSVAAPVLLLLGAVVTLSSSSVPEQVVYASLAVLVVVPLIAALTSGLARFAGYLAVAAGLLVRANEYVSELSPSFTSVAHVVLPLAAAVAAYFSRSR